MGYGFLPHLLNFLSPQQKNPDESQLFMGLLFKPKNLFHVLTNVLENRFWKHKNTKMILTNQCFLICQKEKKMEIKAFWFMFFKTDFKNTGRTIKVVYSLFLELMFSDLLKGTKMETKAFLVYACFLKLFLRIFFFKHKKYYFCVLK